MSFPLCSSIAIRVARVARGLAGMASIGLFAATLASPAQAGVSGPGPGGFVAAVGMRCETRDDLREVAWRHFVLDRVTECAPRLHVPCPSSSDRGAAPRGLPEASGSGTAGVGRRPERGDRMTSDRVVDATIAAERRVRWRGARARLANPQYARTVDALRGAFTRERR